MKRYHGYFSDSVAFDPSEKTAVSVRDGVLEYAGAELGIEPHDKIFQVYRSPATIANTAMKMSGIPVTDEHVTLDVPPPQSGGTVSSAEMVDAIDPATSTTIAIKNHLILSDTLKETVDAGRRELSLGYAADLIPHESFDFEQVNIMPHHLAAVDRGRCGSMCSFLDKKPEGDVMKPNKKLNGAFTDADGALNLQQVVELTASLPEAIKSIPVDQLPQLLPALQSVIDAAKNVMPEPEVDITDGQEPDGDEEGGEMDKKDKKFSDAVAAAVVAKKKEFEDAKDEAVKTHGQTIEKARRFLDDAYDFTGKTTDEIMRDALAIESSSEFSDAELPIAFKMLKQTASNYREFGDSDMAAEFEKIGNKEL